MFEELREALAPHMVEVIMSLITLLLGWISVRVKAWTGMQIEEKHMRALHSALHTGIVAAMGKGTIDRAVLVGIAKEYARQSVPDAIKYLMPNDGVLTTIATAKINEILNGPQKP